MRSSPPVHYTFPWPPFITHSLGWLKDFIAQGYTSFSLNTFPQTLLLPWPFLFQANLATCVMYVYNLTWDQFNNGQQWKSVRQIPAASQSKWFPRFSTHSVFVYGFIVHISRLYNQFISENPILCSVIEPTILGNATPWHIIVELVLNV